LADGFADYNTIGGTASEPLLSEQLFAGFSLFSSGLTVGFSNLFWYTSSSNARCDGEVDDVMNGE
jgi:hypothetical protein